MSSEAFKALYGTTRKNEADLSKGSNSKVITPSFEEITNYIYSEAEQSVKNTSKRFIMGNISLPFPMPIYTEVREDPNC